MSEVLEIVDQTTAGHVRGAIEEFAVKHGDLLTTGLSRLDHVVEQLPGSDHEVTEAVYDNLFGGLTLFTLAKVVFPVREHRVVVSQRTPILKDTDEAVMERVRRNQEEENPDPHFLESTLRPLGGFTGDRYGKVQVEVAVVEGGEMSALKVPKLASVIFAIDARVESQGVQTRVNPGNLPEGRSAIVKRDVPVLDVLSARDRANKAAVAKNG